MPFSGAVRPITMSDLATVSNHMASVLPAVGTDRFAPLLLDLLRAWAQIDEACIVLYPGTAAPVIAYREQPLPGDRPNLDSFIGGTFLLDPYYATAAREQRFGFFALHELAPKGFRSSEYYRTYYRFSGIIDECGYLTPLADGGFANLSLARTGSSSAFDRNCIRRFREVAPLVQTLMQQQWQSLPVTAPAGSTSLRTQLEAALMHFGASVLTAREQQTVQAILHGHTGKAIAAELGISVETVKLHRKNAYRKISVRNQTELFYTFIQALKHCSDSHVEGDPLARLNPTRS